MILIFSVERAEHWESSDILNLDKYNFGWDLRKIYIENGKVNGIINCHKHHQQMD